MRHFVLTSLLCLGCVAAQAASYSYTATFEGSDTGVTPYGIGTGGIVPTIASYNGSNQLKLETLVDSQGSRTGAGVRFAFDPLTIADYTAVTIDMDVTLTVPSTQRHNLYWDFDGIANKYDQTVNDGGNTKMIRDGVQLNIGGGAVPSVETVVNLKWVFDVTAGTVDTFFGATQYDNDLPKTLGQAIDPGSPATTFSEFSFDLVKDWWQAPFGYTVYVDNFSVNAVPEPMSLALLALGALLRRR